MASTIGCGAAERPSVPKLMLIESAPWSVAETSERATLASVRSDFSTISWQS